MLDPFRREPRIAPVDDLCAALTGDTLFRKDTLAANETLGVIPQGASNAVDAPRGPGLIRPSTTKEGSRDTELPLLLGAHSSDATPPMARRCDMIWKPGRRKTSTSAAARAARVDTRTSRPSL